VTTDAQSDVATLVVAFCLGSRVQHDAPGALRGLFFHSRRVVQWCVQRLPPLCCLLPVSAIAHISCCVSVLLSRSVQSVTVLALLAFGHGPLTEISLSFQFIVIIAPQRTWESDCC
jgi:hypothetical protein